MRRLAPLVMLTAAASGCSAAFGIQLVDETTADDTPVDTCAPSTADPLRYATVRNPDPETVAWAWSSARAACQLRGQDLAVIDDLHELSFADTEIMPFWVGATFDGTAWSTVDGCNPTTAAPPPTGTHATCGMLADPTAGVASADCSGIGVMKDIAGDPINVSAALCETPRATTQGCEAAAIFDPAAVRYDLAKAPQSRADAAATCASEGGALVVIDSLAELDFLSAKATAEGWPAFWIGATYDSRAWHADTGCPPLFSWADGGPTTLVAGAAPGAPGTCVAGAWRTPPADPDGGPPPPPYFAGMETVACDAAQTFALCELPMTPPR